MGKQHKVSADSLTICSYQQQIVAGTNYKVVMSTKEDSDNYWVVTIFAALPHTGEAPVVKRIEKKSGSNLAVVYPNVLDDKDVASKLPLSLCSVFATVAVFLS